MYKRQVHGDLESLGAAVGDEDILSGEVHIQRSIVVPDGLDEGGDAGRGCVLQHRQVKAADGIEERLGRLDIRLTDVQVIDCLLYTSGPPPISILPTRRNKKTHAQAEAHA